MRRGDKILVKDHLDGIWRAATFIEKCSEGIRAVIMNYEEYWKYYTEYDSEYEGTANNPNNHDLFYTVSKKDKSRINDVIDWMTKNVDVRKANELKTYLEEKWKRNR